MMELTAQNVDEVIRDCLFTDEEVVALSLRGVDSNDNEALVKNATSAVKVEGLVQSFGFHAGRLESHRADVADMLSQLPEPFREDTGGGWSFLQAPVRADGHQWGEHRDVEALFVLAIGLNLATYLVPREHWNKLPGGMPYISVHKP